MPVWLCCAALLVQIAAASAACEDDSPPSPYPNKLRHRECFDHSGSPSGVFVSDTTRASLIQNFGFEDDSTRLELFDRPPILRNCSSAWVPPACFVEQKGDGEPALRVNIEKNFVDLVPCHNGFIGPDPTDYDYSPTDPENDLTPNQLLSICAAVCALVQAQERFAVVA